MAQAKSCENSALQPENYSAPNTFGMPGSSLLLSHQQYPSNWLNPLTHMSDQDRISPYNINTRPSRQVMRIEKNLNQGIIS